MDEKKLARAALRVGDIIMFSIFWMSVWKIDIAISAIITGGMPTNGFVDFPPKQLYHIGLWGAMSSMLWFALRTFGVYEKIEEAFEG